MFRDYLMKNKESCKEYEKIKKQAIKMGKKNEEYRKHKEKFIEIILSKIKKRERKK